jgi:hypothetical protein
VAAILAGMPNGDQQPLPDGHYYLEAVVLQSTPSVERIRLPAGEADLGR